MGDHQSKKRRFLGWLGCIVGLHKIEPDGLVASLVPDPGRAAIWRCIRCERYLYVDWDRFESYTISAQEADVHVRLDRLRRRQLADG